MKNKIAIFIMFLVSYSVATSKIDTKDLLNKDTLYITNIEGNGSYYCDGISDQIEINRALDRVAKDKSLTTVYLKGPMSCVIDEPILISSNTILRGDKTVKVQLKDNVEWNMPNKPMIGQKNPNGTVAWKIGKYGSGTISNVEISGFELSGGIQKEPTGQYFVMLISFYDPSFIKIHDMNLHDSKGDIIRFYGSNVGKSHDLEVYNNIIKNSGHEGIYFIYPNNIKAYNNKIYATRTNSGIRVSTGSNFSIYGNIIGNSLKKRSSGYAGILIGSSSPTPIGKADIYNNYIYGKNGGIVLEARSGFDSKSSLKDVHIHHNILYKIANYNSNSYLNGAIRINGFHNTLIEYNTIDSSQKDGIVYDEHGREDKRGTGYKTIVRNNIISNCIGSAISNLNPDIHTFNSKYNDFFNNGVKSDDNINNYNIEPLYTHHKLKETSGWHHVVATYDSSTERFKIYVDGAERANQKFLGFGTIGTNNNDISIGSYRGLNYFQLDGLLDDMAVWNRALNSKEVLSLWNNGDGKRVDDSNLTRGLEAYWQMENNWLDTLNNYNSNQDWSTATFTTNAKVGNYSGLFNKNAHTFFPNRLSPSLALTISVWVYRDKKSIEDKDIQTIFNKGAEENNNHIWLYAKGNRIYFELGNGNGVRHSISSLGELNPEELDFHLKSKYGRWSSKKGWIKDSVTSLLIDKGESKLHKKVNLGAYGDTPEESKGELDNNLSSKAPQ